MRIFWIVAAAGVLLAGCTVSRTDLLYQPRAQYSPAAAQLIAREVLEPSDFPRTMSDCSVGHSANSRYVQTEQGVSFAVRESNSRDCKQERFIRSSSGWERSTGE